jgi:hypothetical protein
MDADVRAQTNAPPPGNGNDTIVIRLRADTRRRRAPFALTEVALTPPVEPSISDTARINTLNDD